jgi:hypothetical protein
MVAEATLLNDGGNVINIGDDSPFYLGTSWLLGLAPSDRIPSVPVHQPTVACSWENRLLAE